MKILNKMKTQHYRQQLILFKKLTSLHLKRKIMLKSQLL